MVHASLYGMMRHRPKETILQPSKEKGRGSGVVCQYQHNTLDVGLLSTNLYIGGAFRKNRLTRATFKP